MVSTERSGRIVWFVFAAASALFTVAIVYLTRQLWFQYDEFSYLTETNANGLGGWFGQLVAPHNEHIIVWTRLWYWALINTVGVSDYWPYALLGIVGNIVISAAVLAISLRLTGQRVLSLLAAVTVMVAGVGAQDLLWAGQNAFLIPVAVFFAWIWLDVTKRLPDTGWKLYVAAFVTGTIGILGSQVFLPLALALAIGLAATSRWRAAIAMLVMPVAIATIGRLQQLPDAAVASTSSNKGAIQNLNFIANGLVQPFDVPLGITGIGWLLVAVTIVGLVFGLRDPLLRNPMLTIAAALVISLAVFSLARASLFDGTIPYRYLHVVYVLAIPLLVIGLARIADVMADRSITAGRIVLIITGLVLIVLTVASYRPYNGLFQALKKTTYGQRMILQGATNLVSEGFQAPPDQNANRGFLPPVTVSELQHWLAAGYITTEPVPDPVTAQARVNLSYTLSKDPLVLGSQAVLKCAPYTSPVTVGAGVLLLADSPTFVDYTVVTPGAAQSTTTPPAKSVTTFAIVANVGVNPKEVPATFQITSKVPNVRVCQQP